MRKFLLLAWMVVPVAAAAYHYGPGQQRLVLDEVADRLAQADRHAADVRWSQAFAGYTDALGLLPPDLQHEARRIRIERAKAALLSHQLPAAYLDLTALVDEMKSDPQAEPDTLAEARRVLANTQYYLTWLMRLEARPRDEWEPEIEAARQAYRLLAEQAEQRGEAEQAQAHREDLEAVIRLARMDLGELQGMAIPSQCKGCESGQCKGKKPGRNKSRGKGKPQDVRGASSGVPPDGSGS